MTYKQKLLHFIADKISIGEMEKCRDSDNYLYNFILKELSFYMRSRNRIYKLLKRIGDEL